MKNEFKLGVWSKRKGRGCGPSLAGLVGLGADPQKLFYFKSLGLQNMHLESIIYG